MTKFFVLLLFLLETSQILKFHWIVKQDAAAAIDNTFSQIAKQKHRRESPLQKRPS
uniref:Uncharacterized protein n=1 Tax=Rousettus aegyptiacus TaxID=9407 RepID=A0A7J8KEN3_ROUAE|nr:hypothetical protein HJG63_015709 [Rousettus aegyptiacus]